MPVRLMSKGLSGSVLTRCSAVARSAGGRAERDTHRRRRAGRQASLSSGGVTTKSAAFAPLTVALPREHDEAVVAGMVKDWPAVWPTLMEPNETGDRAIDDARAGSFRHRDVGQRGWFRSDESSTSKGLLSSVLLAMCSVAEREAAEPRVNVTTNVAEPPGGTVVRPGVGLSLSPDAFAPSTVMLPSTSAVVLPIMNGEGDGGHADAAVAKVNRTEAGGQPGSDRLLHCNLRRRGWLRKALPIAMMSKVFSSRRCYRCAVPRRAIRPRSA